MSHSSLSTGKEIFILRLRHTTSQEFAWRGQIQHVRTGKMVYVKSLEELVNYIQGQMQQYSGVPSEQDIPGRLK